eukprot:TRINITY_DN42828_c0_g1_i1.p1 TRINITY_DN42828_c0_g1~~TRINITY_DN42828_c0_g1_i1.p1  ORF type:complete len:483 (+),score=63.04 TRINITY_DN42828_c0_g1_i1:50-1498(+)
MGILQHVNNKVVLATLVVVVIIKHASEGTRIVPPPHAAVQAHPPVVTTAGKAKTKSLCGKKDFDGAGSGYLSIGGEDQLSGEVGQAAVGNAQWVTIRVPDSMADDGKMRKRDMYLMFLHRIKAYLDILPPTAKVGVVGSRNPYINYVQKLACDCLGSGYIPPESFQGSGEVVRRSICEGSKREFWTFLDEKKQACVDAEEELRHGDVTPMEPDAGVLGEINKNCLKMTDVYPGKLVKNHWRPRNCDLRRYLPGDAIQCLRSKPFVSVGDSVVKIFHDYFKLLFTLSTDVAERADGGKYLRHVSHGTGGEGVVDVAFVSKTARVVLISIALRDLVQDFTSTDALYEAFEAQITAYKRLIHPSARLILLNIPYLHLSKSPSLSTCLPPKKLVVFREMLRTLASCHSVPILDTYPLQKSTPESTQDGARIWGNGAAAASEILLNVMCEGVDLPEPEELCSPSAVRAAKERWRTDAFVNKRPPECY